MNDARADVLIVAGEPCWPAVNGGRLRTGALAAALAHAFRVTVAAPPDVTELDSSTVEPPVETIDLPPREQPSARHSAGIGPRLGRALLGPAAVAAVAESVERLEPAVVLFSMSYLAATCPVPPGPQVVVDFANIEVDRLRSLARGGSAKQRASSRFEARKAVLWEPRLARRATLALAVDGRDADRLRAWGARAIVVPNTAVRPPQHEPSRPEAPVVMVAGGSYRPNVEAGTWLIERVWPLVRERVPSAGLQIVGHRSDTVFGRAHGRAGITVKGSVVDLNELIEDAAVVVAPVSRGGGTQLKVVEALAAGRAVVVTDYGARSVPPSLAGAAVVASDTASFAKAISDLLTDPGERHRRELEAWNGHLPTWDEAALPLVSALRELSTAAPAPADLLRERYA